jgi:hypothetical protein
MQLGGEMLKNLSAPVGGLSPTLQFVKRKR